MDANGTSAAAASGSGFRLRSSIRGKLTTFVAVLVLLTAGAMILAHYLAARAILRDQIDERLSVVAADRQRMLLAYVRQQEERAALITNRTRLRRLLEDRAAGRIALEAFRAEASQSLADVLAGTQGFLALWIVDPQGRVIAATDAGDLDRDISASAGFAAGRQEVYLGPPHRVGAVDLAALMMPARDPEGRVLGVVGVLLDAGPFVRLLTDTTGLGQSGEVLVGMRIGDRIQHLLPPRQAPLGEPAGYPPERVQAMSLALAGQTGTLPTIDYRGVRVLAAYRPVGYGGWGLIAKIDQEEAYAPVTWLRWWSCVLGAVILLAGLSASFALARRFTRPIRRLAELAGAVAAGVLDVRAAEVPHDEIGALGAAFNRMTEELRRSYATLERRVAERTAELEASRDLLSEFFAISTSLQDPDNLERTFDSVLRCCRRLGYDQAMLSLVDAPAGVIRAVRAQGTMAELVARTVRPLDGPDILAEVVRTGRPAVIADSTRDPRCETTAVAAAGVCGQIVVPLISGEVLGTLQVAVGSALDPAALDLRPLETLAGQAARALAGLKQLEEIRRLNRHLEDHAQELARSEATLREQTRILRSILDCMGDGVVVADPAGAFLIFNPTAERILGRGPADVPPARWSRHYGLLRPDGVTPFPPGELPLARALRGEAVDQQEMLVRHERRPEGVWIGVTARPLQDETGGRHGAVIVFQDISARKRSEQRRAVLHATTRVLAESGTIDAAAPQILAAIGEGLQWDLGAIWRVDPGVQRLRCVETWRPPGAFAAVAALEAQTRQMSFAPGVGLPGQVWETARPCWVDDVADQPGFARAAAAGAAGLHTAFGFPIPLRGEILGVVEFFSREARRPDDDLLQMGANLGSQIGLFFERHRMHTRVVQSEKLASLGLLSAGVAHEINNPLAYVANNLAVLERDTGSLIGLIGAYQEALDAPEPDRAARAAAIVQTAAEIDLPYVLENLGRILKSTRDGVRRVADIVQNLRGFARLDQAAVDRVDIHEAITGSLEMIRGRLGRRRIAVEQHFGALPPVRCSPAQINQVFLNLLVNAMQALEAQRDGEGRIVITTRAAPGAVVVEVADNGAGIPEHIRPRIFDPFFTTKPVGEGTGLGLSITHSIVADHGGRIEVDSTPGQGTCFRVILPTGETKEPPVATIEPATQALPPGRG
ncbi:MAG TPA: GAF domain-containing protein [Isosphaeraceae bacterium]